MNKLITKNKEEGCGIGGVDLGYVSL